MDHRVRESRTRSQTVRDSDCWRFLPGASAVCSWAYSDQHLLLQYIHKAKIDPGIPQFVVSINQQAPLGPNYKFSLKRSRQGHLGLLSTLVHVVRRLGWGWVSMPVEHTDPGVPIGVPVFLQPALPGVYRWRLQVDSNGVLQNSHLSIPCHKCHPDILVMYCVLKRGSSLIQVIWKVVWRQCFILTITIIFFRKDNLRIKPTVSHLCNIKFAFIIHIRK